MTGNIFNIQPFSVNDGPGGRTTVFMKGCNLRCEWCHNPESQRSGIDIQLYPNKCIGCGECVKACPFTVDGDKALFTEKCDCCGKCADVCYAEALVKTGYTISSNEVFSRLLKDKSFFLSSGGGVTFSGGEPLLQADFVAEVMKLCKGEDIHTAVETALCVDKKEIDKLFPYCDLFVCDLKSADSEKHRKATGAGNEKITENLRYIAEKQAHLLVRTPVIPSFNDTEDDISAIASIVSELKSVDRNFVGYELLKFHSICASKYDSLKRVFKSAGLAEPSAEDMKKLGNIKNKFNL